MIVIDAHAVKASASQDAERILKVLLRFARKADQYLCVEHQFGAHSTQRHERTLRVRRRVPAPHLLQDCLAAGLQGKREVTHPIGIRSKQGEQGPPST